MKHLDLIQLILSEVTGQVLPVQESDVLRDYPQLDSMKLIRFVIALEKRAKVKFSTQAVLSLRTVGDVKVALEKLGAHES